jgi:hypothetical protein
MFVQNSLIKRFGEFGFDVFTLRMWEEYAKQNKIRKLLGCDSVNDADILDEGFKKTYHWRSHGRANTVN